MRHLCLGAELVGADGKDLDRVGLLLGELIFTARHVAHEGGQRGELFFTVQKFDMADAGDGGEVVPAMAGDIVLVDSRYKTYTLLYIGEIGGPTPYYI